ncbi:serine hydrolase domain-containing protein [Streptosporangium sp. NPDC049376]|uniref:serine hydrolase domain-containing protein n=1 Tax=Streptosporangium sp. NPDC049376 TaxID=3366192 RepID=UPI003791B0DC
MTLLPDLQGWIDRAAERHGVPGAAVAVGMGDQLAEAATGVVNLDTGVEATVDSLFQIGSVTKTWTVALVMQLAGEGLVDLDEPVRRYLPEFGVLDAAASESITVRQLLSHTGGFDGDLFEDTGRGEDAVAKFVAFMRGNARQVSGPGELFSYCNAGYCALGALVAKLRGRTWEAAMRELLIDPLGARHMALYAEEAIMFRAAVGHVGEPLRVSPRRQLPQSNAPAGSTPSAAPRDLVRFGRMLLADGVAADGTRVLPSGTFAEMRRPQVTLPRLGERYPAAWGLGLMLFDWDGEAVVGHDGSTPGQSAIWRIVPGRGLVLAVHANGGHTSAFIDEVLAEILSATAGIRLPSRVLPPDTPVPFLPEVCTGRYSAPSVTYEVRADADGLEITDIPHGLAAQFGESGTTARYVHAGDNRFVGVEPDGGLHPLISFLQGGRFLYNLRAVPRVTS